MIKKTIITVIIVIISFSACAQDAANAELSALFAKIKIQTPKGFQKMEASFCDVNLCFVADDRAPEYKNDHPDITIDFQNLAAYMAPEPTTIEECNTGDPRYNKSEITANIYGKKMCCIDVEIYNGHSFCYADAAAFYTGGQYDFYTTFTTIIGDKILTINSKEYYSTGSALSGGPGSPALIREIQAAAKQNKRKILNAEREILSSMQFSEYTQK